MTAPGVPDLSTNLCGIQLRNPVLTASGTFGYGTELAPFMDLRRIGGLCRADHCFCAQYILILPVPCFLSLPFSIRFLDMLTFFSKFFHNVIKSFFIDSPDPLGRQLQCDPFIFFGQVITLHLQIRQKPAFTLDIRVRNIVPGKGNFTCNLTNSSHIVQKI